MLAGRLAKERGFDEALLVTPHGRVLEGPTWSFFWVEGGQLFTPPLEDRILASITRARLLEECEVEERRARSTTCAPPRRRSSPRPSARSCRSRRSTTSSCPAAPGPVTQDAHARFQARVERELAATPA